MYVGARATTCVRYARAYRTVALIEACDATDWRNTALRGASHDFDALGTQSCLVRGRATRVYERDVVRMCGPRAGPRD